jgi:hypothetical protein
MAKFPLKAHVLVHIGPTGVTGRNHVRVATPQNENSTERDFWSPQRSGWYIASCCDVKVGNFPSLYQLQR